MREKLGFILVMLTFGSIGLFVKNINLSSSEIALFRGAIGSLVIIFASIFLKKSFQLHATKRNLLLLIISGGAMGFNWIFLFEAYRYTTVANATLSYYFAPVFVMLLAPYILKEKWTVKKGISIVAALAGLYLVINPGVGVSGDYQHVTGVGYGLLAATLYASVILINQFIKNMDSFERTTVQLVMATLVLFPYVWFTENISVSGLDATSFILMLIVGLFHTGVAYLVYFSVLPKLSAQTVAVMSYIDPISAVFMSAMLLSESITFLQIAGGILILGSTLISEIKPRKVAKPAKKEIM